MWATDEQWRVPARREQRGWVQPEQPHQLTVLTARVLYTVIAVQELDTPSADILANYSSVTIANQPHLARYSSA